MKESSFKFTNPIIESIIYEINTAYTISNKEVEMVQEFAVNTQKDKANGKAIVRLQIGINKSELGDNKKDKPFALIMVIKSDFEWRDEYDEKTINDLLTINAPALLLSYARPNIALITTTAPTGSYSIPFFNFVKN